MASKPTVRPLISAKARDLVGSAREDSTFMNNGQDLTYIQGYSNVRRQMDADLARGREPSTGLNYRFQYVTVQRPNGKPDSAKAMQFRALGYRPVKAEEAAAYGIEVPVQAFQTADGYIQVGDAQLFVCDAATAARNEAHGRSAIDERTTDEATSQELRSVGRELGGVGNDLVETSLEQRHTSTKG